MNKQTAALISLYAGWMLTADTAHTATYEDITGQWCGDVTDYVFTPDTLTVKFHDDRPANVFKITKYTYTDDSVRIHWLNGADELVMVFAEFNGSHTAMAQQENDDKRAELSIAAESSSYLVAQARTQAAGHARPDTTA